MAATDMTEGSISRQLIRYSVPLILGNLFQLTYNAVDSIIAGRFIGKEALAAVGMANPIMNIVILGISGICIGAGVLMSSFFGAKKYDSLRKEMSTAVLFGCFFSLAVVVLGIAFTRPLLRTLHVPDGLLEMTTIYLRIIFLGAPFTYFYNALAAALKSVGDSKTPLKFLMFSAILNGVLDLIFIGGLGFGIVCSAITTVIAEGVSAILSILYIYKKVPLLCLGAGEFKIDGALLKMTLQYGTVTAIQQSCQPVGKLLIQGTVNSLGVDMIAAFNAVGRIDDFAFTPEQSISHGITTFVAQNRGAGKTERARRGFGQGLRLEFCYWVLICTIITLVRKPAMSSFVTGESAQTIILLGTQYLGIMAWLYLLPAITNGFQGFYRGIGKMHVTLIGTVLQTGLRVIFTWLLAPGLGLIGIAFACGIGWSFMLLFQVPYYFCCKK